MFSIQQTHEDKIRKATECEIFVDFTQLRLTNSRSGGKRVALGGLARSATGSPEVLTLDLKSLCFFMAQGGKPP